ncbi:N-alpha-acetyltransferase 30 [Phytophthora cinnamomi]|uniref:N-alpha-acetyltransferase 30 n=1 Tax=Phytophthora cinnamomi TaxID=4785 RepID=UPI00355A31C5|nr:N-alpha-acetyltransferase 30 [Phytophthora cinnamomi]
MAKSKSSGAAPADADAVVFSTYQGEKQLAELVKLIDKDLSEPYSIFTYRYFLYNWPQLSILARVQHKLVGVIICRQEPLGASPEETGDDGLHAQGDPRRRWRGYIAMLAVEKQFRHRGIGSQLAQKAIERMRDDGCEEVMLETEIANKGAIRLYENLGFVRDERLVKYYLNGGDAYRLKLWLQ